MANKTKQRIINFFVVTHQWSGFILCILFFVWFVSGFVLMYKDFPYLQPSEILQKTSELDPNNSLLPPSSFLPDSLLDSQIGISLTTQLQRPIYRIVTPGGSALTYFGDDGTLFSNITENQALAIISDFEGQPIEAENIILDDWLDQWTPRTRFIPYLPWFKVRSADSNGMVYYVSSVNGEIKQKLNNLDKFWAWIGAIPHWIYFKDLRIATQKWRDLVVGLSIVGVLMSITGIIVGLFRIKRNKGIKFSPYKKFWFKWHHYTGFIFGIFVFTFILSGLFSMNPWSWSPPTSLNAEENERWEGIAFNAGLIPPNIRQIVSQMSSNGALKQVEFSTFDGNLLLTGIYSDRKPLMAKVNGSDFEMVEKLTIQEVEAKLRETLKTAPSSIRELDAYDSYYVDKWKKKPLPIYKATFQDEQGTLVYVDPFTSKIAYKYTTINRWERWLYHGLHSFNFPFLLQNRPLWDIVMWIMGLGGLAVSITGVILTWRWIKRKSRNALTSGIRAGSN